MRDEGEHGADREVFEEQSGVIDDPGLLLVGVDVHLPHGEVWVRSRVAFPAGGGNVLRVDHRERVLRRADVVDPMAGATVGHGPGAEFARHASVAIMSKFGIDSEQVTTYQNSFHGVARRALLRDVGREYGGLRIL